MTNSLFDPNSPDVERRGDRFTGEQASNRSHMPPRAVDGEVETDEQAAGPKEMHNQTPGLPTDSTEAAKRLAEMSDPEAPAQ